MHRANVEDPEIPEALADAVAGIASLHDFRSQPALASVAASASPDATSGTSHYLAPADFVTIYDVHALYSSGIDGSGASIAVVAHQSTDLQMRKPSVA